MKYIVAVASLFLANLAITDRVEAQACDTPKGTWVNEFGSTLDIRSFDKKSGKIEGVYISPSGTAGEERPLTGWVNSQPPSTGKHNSVVISFMVNWGNYGSVTAWSGTCNAVGGNPVISTIWNLARANSSFEWDHILTNTDKFSPK